MPKLRFPHPLALLTGCLLLAATLSWLVPAGQYDRVEDAESGRSIVVPGTFRTVPAEPVGLLQALVSIPLGMADAGGVIFFIFLVGGSFAVVEQTGSLRSAVTWLLYRFRKRRELLVILICLLFCAGGVLNNLQEEIVALAPILLLLARRLGCGPLFAALISLGPAGIGSAFSPINPFQVGLAQTVAQVPLLSGAGFRSAFLVPAMVIWIWICLRFLNRQAGQSDPQTEGGPPATPSLREQWVIGIFAAAFVLFVYGVLALGWGFDEMSGMFFGMGVLAGLVGGLGVAGTARSFADGFRSMTDAALLVGMARAIFVVMEQGKIVDTLVHGLFTPLEQLPLALSGLGMLAAQLLIHVPVSSTSGQAVLTMPVAAPLADLLGISRQIAVLAYQYGAGMMDVLTPTNGSMMAVLAAFNVRYEDWIRFAGPRLLSLVGLAAIAIITAIAIDLR